MEAWLEAVATNLEACSYLSVEDLARERAAAVFSDDGGED